VNKQNDSYLSWTQISQIKMRLRFHEINEISKIQVLLVGGGEKFIFSKTVTKLIFLVDPCDKSFFGLGQLNFFEKINFVSGELDE
jgi:uncharacterized protein (UPF0548 family)